jgi:hypothetical protein
MPLDEIPKPKTPVPTLKIEEEPTSIFDLTGGDKLDTEMPIEKRQNRFETPSINEALNNKSSLSSLEKFT